MLSNLLSDVELAHKLGQEDRLSEAYHLLKNIENYVATESEEIKNAVEEEVKKSSVLQDVKIFGQEMTALMELIDTNESFNIWNTGIGMHGDVTVSTHKNEERGKYYCKIEGRVLHSMVHVLAACLEHSLYRHWLPLCTDTEVLATPNANRRIFHADFDFALAKREATISTYGDVLPDGRLLMMIKSYNENDKFANKGAPPLKKTAVGHKDSQMLIGGGIVLEELSAADLKEIERKAQEAIDKQKKKEMLAEKKDSQQDAKQPGAESLNRSAAPIASRRGSAMNMFTGMFNRNKAGAAALNGGEPVQEEKEKEKDKAKDKGRGSSLENKSRDASSVAVVHHDHVKFEDIGEDEENAGRGGGRAVSNKPFDTPSKVNVQNLPSPIIIPSSSSGAGGGGSSSKTNPLASSPVNRKYDGPAVSFKAVFKLNPQMGFLPDWM